MPVTLKSNSGEKEFTIELVAPAAYAHDPGFEATIHLRGEHWDGDHTHPLSTSIEGLWLRSVDLIDLRDHVAKWTSQPLDRLTVEGLIGHFQLARLPHQTVNVRFGARSDTIQSLNPVVSINFSAGTLHGQFHFVTDQSCLSIFAEELSTQLRGSHRSNV